MGNVDGVGRGGGDVGGRMPAYGKYRAHAFGNVGSEVIAYFENARAGYNVPGAILFVYAPGMTEQSIRCVFATPGNTYP